jgi:hypothetical protein
MWHAWERRLKLTGLRWANLNTLDVSENLGIDGKIILK